MIEKAFGVKNKKYELIPWEAWVDLLTVLKPKKKKKLILATCIVHYYLTSVDLRNKDLGHLGLYFKWYF